MADIMEDEMYQLVIFRIDTQGFIRAVNIRRGVAMLKTFCHHLK